MADRSTPTDLAFDGNRLSKQSPPSSRSQTSAALLSPALLLLSVTSLLTVCRPYSFVSLTEQETARRRRLLDGYGILAEVSGVVPLCLICTFYGIRRTVCRIDTISKSGIMSEHQHDLSSKRNVLSRAIGFVLKWGRIVAWWLDDEVMEGWETRRRTLIAGCWAAWLGFLVVRDTGNDYLHLTKRFGIIAASQLPMHYLLALKSPHSPIQALTRLTHEQLNPYHRLLGRTIFVLFVTHATMYLNFYLQHALLAKRLVSTDVQLGLLALTLLVVLNTSALHPFRARAYALFHTLHIAISLAILPTIYFHVSHARPYIYQASAIYFLLLLDRYYLSLHQATGTATLLTGTPLLAITLGPSRYWPRPIAPGQHIYLSSPHPRAVLPSLNPFTIANMPGPDTPTRLVARTRAGATTRLRATAPAPFLISSPVGSAAGFPPLASFDRLLLVAGGVGATFILPIFLSLLPSAGIDLRPRLRFVWSVRGEEEARWGLDVLKDVKGGVQAATLCVTGGEELGHGLVEGVHGVKLEHGRMNVRKVVGDAFEGDAKKVAVLVCGPGELGRDVRKEVGRWVWRGMCVFWHDEHFES